MIRSPVIVVVALALLATAYFGFSGKLSFKRNASEVLVIRGGLLIDGTGRPPLADSVIVITGGKIRQVFREGDDIIPANARMIDARGKSILPGLIDVHVHLIIGSAGSANSPLEYTPDRAVRDLRAYLYWGITTIRSAGDMLNWVLRLRDSERNDSSISPRLYVVGPIITATGGHPARYLPAAVASEATREVNNLDQVRSVIQELAGKKVDMIKIVYDGGSNWDRFPKLPLALLRGAVEQAHHSGLRVSVHTWTVADLKDAVRCGVDGVEHGATDQLDAEAIHLMREHKTFYCPTLAVHQSHARSLKEVEDVLKRNDVQQTLSPAVLDGLAKHLGYYFETRNRPDLMDYFRDVMKTSQQNLQMAARNDVKIVLGTDSGEPTVFHGLAAHDELRLMVSSGMTPMQSIVAGTRDAAEYLGLGESLGTLEVGKLADVLIVEGNLVESIEATKQIRWVIKNGEIIDRGRLLGRHDWSSLN